MLHSFFIISPLITLLLLFWYKTEFVLIYGKMFGLSKILKFDLYAEKKNYNLNLSYSSFITLTYKNFFSKLLSCEVCLSTWLSIIFCFTHYFIFSETIILFFIPLNIIFGLLIYLIIKKLN